MDSRTKSILAHLTIFGWIAALIINSNNKDEYTSFYLRQTIGIYIVGALISWIPVVGWLSMLIIFAFWLLSFVYSLQGTQKVIPFGEYFQDWFKGL
jgi:uncharacterized membrane protein